MLKGILCKVKRTNNRSLDRSPDLSCWAMATIVMEQLYSHLSQPRIQEELDMVKSFQFKLLVLVQVVEIRYQAWETLEHHHSSVLKSHHATLLTSSKGRGIMLGALCQTPLLSVAIQQMQRMNLQKTLVRHHQGTNRAAEALRDRIFMELSQSSKKDKSTHSICLQDRW